MVGKKALHLSRRRFLALSSQAVAAMALASCAPTVTPPPAATKPPAPAPTSITPFALKKGGTLTYAHPGEFEGFNPHIFYAVNFPMFNLLYNSLVVLDKDMRPHPELAESWQLSDGDRTLTFKLRQGVKFHSGRELVSEDVKFNLERIQDPVNKANARLLALLVDKIETPDKHTVVLRLKRVAPNIFDLLDLTYIMAPESAPDITRSGVGTGPFKLQEWHSGESAKFTRFPDYFKSGLPLLDEVVVRVLEDTTSMVVGLENGSIDVIERLPPQDAARLQKTRGVQVNNVFGGQIADILINAQEKPFDNKLARQALNLAVDRQRMIDMAMGGIGEPWCLPFPKNSIAYHADMAGGCKQDLEQAKRLLEQAGLGSGFEFELLVSADILPASLLQAQVWQADLAQIGVKARIVDAESADYYDRHMNGKYEVALHQFRGANRDPDSLFLSVLVWFTKNNLSKFESPEYTHLVEEAGSTADVAKRKMLYKDLSKLILDEAFALCIAPAPSLWGFRNRVQGLEWNVEGLPKYENVSLA